DAGRAPTPPAGARSPRPAAARPPPPAAARVSPTLDVLAAPPHLEGAPDKLLDPGVRHGHRLVDTNTPLAHVEARQQRPVGVDLRDISDVERNVMFLRIEGDGDAPVVAVAEHLVVDSLG